MKILVDADACPVVSIVEHVASKYRIPVILLCDTNHVLRSADSEIKVVGAGADAVQMQWTLHWSVYARRETLW